MGKVSIENWAHRLLNGQTEVDNDEMRDSSKRFSACWRTLKGHNHNFVVGFT